MRQRRKKTPEIRHCLWCGAKFPSLYNKLYCCKSHATYAWHAQKRRQSPTFGQYDPTNPQTNKILELQRAGLSYTTIATRLGITKNAVAGIVDRHRDYSTTIQRLDAIENAFNAKMAELESIR